MSIMLAIFFCSSALPLFLSHVLSFSPFFSFFLFFFPSRFHKPRIKSERGRGGIVSDIFYRNIVASNLSAMISITLEYVPANMTFMLLDLGASLGVSAS